MYVYVSKLFRKFRNSRPAKTWGQTRSRGLRIWSRDSRRSRMERWQGTGSVSLRLPEMLGSCVNQRKRSLLSGDTGDHPTACPCKKQRGCSEGWGVRRSYQKIWEPGARSRGHWPSCSAGRDWTRPWTWTLGPRTQFHTSTSFMLQQRELAHDRNSSITSSAPGWRWSGSCWKWWRERSRRPRRRGPENRPGPAAEVGEEDEVQGGDLESQRAEQVRSSLPRSWARLCAVSLWGALLFLGFPACASERLPSTFLPTLGLKLACRRAAAWSFWGNSSLPSQPPSCGCFGTSEVLILAAREWIQVFLFLMLWLKIRNLGNDVNCLSLSTVKRITALSGLEQEVEQWWGQVPRMRRASALALDKAWRAPSSFFRSLELPVLAVGVGLGDSHSSRFSLSLSCPLR